MVPVYYYEKHMQQRQWELEREAKKQRLIESMHPQGHVHFMSRAGDWFRALGLQLKAGKQTQSQPKVLTGNL